MSQYFWSSLFIHSLYRWYVENKQSVEEFVKTFTLLSSFSGLKPNISICEICGLGLLKGVEMAACGMQSVGLTRDDVKILDI